MMATARPIMRLTPRGEAHPRLLPEEVAVAITVNGSAQAVMMATPADLEDFATGFALTEGLVQPHEIRRLEITQLDRGIDARLWVTAEAEARLATRRRYMAGPVGCGLCGLDSIDAALRPLTPLDLDDRQITAAAITAAVQDLPAHQPLHDRVRAAHCAAFWDGTQISLAREDIGRHNALDKLAGALIRSGQSAETGALIITSRLSIDLVQKAAVMRCPIVISLSAPTATAVDLAQKVGITLICSANPKGFDLYTHPKRYVEG